MALAELGNWLVKKEIADVGSVAERARKWDAEGKRGGPCATVRLRGAF